MSWFTSPTDIPTDRHWIPDDEVHICSMPGCQNDFGWFTRKHHCRRCGEIVCSNHFGFKIKLNKFAVPDANGIDCEVCEHCYKSNQKRLTGNNTNASNEVLKAPFCMPSIPENVPIPELIEVPRGKEIYLGSLLSHLKLVITYFDTVRTNLINSRDSVFKREYMKAEKPKFDQYLANLISAEESLNEIIIHYKSDARLISYLHNCCLSIQPIKTWLSSMEIFLLRNGMKLPFVIGSLPEDDFAAIEDRMVNYENLGEGLMSNLFDVSKEEQSRMLQKLNWLKAKMEHDAIEYSLIPGAEMSSFQERLRKSIEYIDMYLDICEGSAKLEDFQSTVDQFEKEFKRIQDEIEFASRDTVDMNITEELKDKYIILIRDIRIFKGVLVKSTEGTAKSDMPPYEKLKPLLEKLDLLEKMLMESEEKIKFKFKTVEDLHNKASEMYQGLQVRRANERREKIEEEMFDL